MNLKYVFAFLAAALVSTPVLQAADGTWTATAGGDWSAPANWQGATPAEGSGATASFTSGAGTVNNDVAGLALRGLQLDGTGFSFAGNAITLDNAGFLTVLGGSHTVGLPLSLSGDTTVSAAPGQSLALGGAVSGSGGLTFTGGRLALNAANTFTGPFRHVRGLVSFSDPAALGAGAAPVVLGEGTLCYTGPDATLARGLTLRPGTAPDTNRAAVIDIADPAATLTVSGQVLTDHGAFIKTGEGTLALTYPGYQEIGKTAYGQQTGILEYDADGIPLTNRYNRFTVERGTLRLGAPGQTNLIQAGWVGCCNDYSPLLEITGGYHRFVSDYFTVGRGTGSFASPQSPGMAISGGAQVSIEGSGFVLDNAHSKTNHCGRPWLRVDGGSTFKVTGHVFLGEDGKATGTVDVANGSLFISDNQQNDRGMIVSPSAGAAITATFDSASTNRAYLLRVARGGKAVYRGGSVLELDGSPINATAGANTEGSVTFDDATLKQRSPTRSSDWFTGSHALTVGPGGLTVDASNYAWLAPVLKPAGAGGAVTKTGAGTLAIAPPQVPVTVAAGTLALAADAANVNPAPAAPVTVLPGASVEVSGANALAVTPVSTASLRLKAPTLTQASEEWAFTGTAQAGRTDGHLRLTPDLSAGPGAAYLLRKRRVTGPWTARFTYRAYSQNTPADGMAFIVQNDPRGTAALGGGAQHAGYQMSTGAGVSNSVAVGLMGYYRWLALGRGGLWTVTNTVLPALTNTGGPHFVTVRYDGEGTLAVEVARPDRDFHYAQSYPVDLAAEIGADEAYVGFAAGTGASFAAHTVTDFTFESGADAPPPAAAPFRLGGAFTLGAGETLSVNLRPSAAQSAFALGPLAYAAGAALDIAAEPAGPAPDALPAISIADPALWQINGAAHWLPDGSLATSTNATAAAGVLTSGSAFTTNKYLVASSWTAKIGYRLGLANASPADLFCFQFQTGSPVTINENTGFSLMWRYYDGAIRDTQLKTVAAGVTVVRNANIAPVDLKNGAPADFTVTYDEPAKTMTVTSVQNGGTNVTVIADLDIAKALGGQTEAYVGFVGRTGGSYAENIVTDFSFTPAALALGAASAKPPASLAFDSYAGAGPLTVRGGNLGLPGDIDRPASSLAVKLEEGGGLILGKTALEPLDSTLGPRSDWLYSAIGSWAVSSAMQFCDNIGSTNGTVTSTRRVRVSDAWTASFDFTWGAGMNTPADAFCFFLHNDPRGPGYSRGNTVAAGFDAMQNSFGVRWYFYPGNASGEKNRVAIGRNGAFDTATKQLHEPVIFYSNAVTRVTVRYDPAAHTLTAIISNDGPRSDSLNPARERLAVTNVFTGVDLPATLGADYAYVGFGGGTGGVAAKMRASDFRFAADAPSDALAAVDSLASLALAAGVSGTVTLASPVADGTFNIPALTLGEEAALKLTAHNAQPSALKFATVTLDGAGAFDTAAAVRSEAAAVTGAGPLRKLGAGALALTGPASYTGATLLAAGILELPAANLPSDTGLAVASGATLHLAFTGKQYVYTLTVDGVPQKGGLYTSANAPWITGPGILVVKYPPTGFLLMLK